MLQPSLLGVCNRVVIVGTSSAKRKSSIREQGIGLGSKSHTVSSNLRIKVRLTRLDVRGHKRMIAQHSTDIQGVCSRSIQKHTDFRFRAPYTSSAFKSQHSQQGTQVTTKGIIQLERNRMRCSSIDWYNISASLPLLGGDPEIRKTPRQQKACPYPS